MIPNALPALDFDLGPTADMLQESIFDFAQAKIAPQAAEIDQSNEFPMELWQQMGEVGLLGITVPEEYGGSGMDAVAACVAHEELSAADPAFCLSYLAHSMLFVNNLARNGPHAQKEEWLPRTSAFRPSAL